MDIQIFMGGQRQYEAAIKKYGKDFADAVVAYELQLHADNIDCFDEYAESEFMADFETEQALKEIEELHKERRYANAII